MIAGKSCLEVIQENVFKSDLEMLLKKGSQSGYSKPERFPLLYKYSSISEYVIANLENNKISLSPASNFNDYFDSSLYISVSNTAGKDEVNELFKLADEANIDIECLNKETLANQLQEAYERDQYTNFTSSDYFGVKVCSFSTDPQSILMWSHYSDNNQGICIGYDYNGNVQKDILKHMLYPVAYCKSQIELNQYFDNKKSVCKYPADVALYAGALQKASCWAYENEWRIVFISLSESQEYITVDNCTKPSKIILGYHWLKPLFNKDRYLNHKKLIIRLFDYCYANDLPIHITLPCIGDFKQRLLYTNAIKLKEFVISEFEEKYHADIKYYRVTQKEMINIFTEEVW